MESHLLSVGSLQLSMSTTTETTALSEYLFLSLSYLALDFVLFRLVLKLTIVC